MKEEGPYALAMTVVDELRALRVVTAAEVRDLPSPCCQT
jgi:hypothetical protein